MVNELQVLLFDSKDYRWLICSNLALLYLNLEQSGGVIEHLDANSENFAQSFGHSHRRCSTAAVSSRVIHRLRHLSVYFTTDTEEEKKNKKQNGDQKMFRPAAQVKKKQKKTRLQSVDSLVFQDQKWLNHHHSISKR